MSGSIVPANTPVTAQLRSLGTFFVSIILLLGTFTPAHAQFAGGTGTQADPYLVETAQHLDSIRHHLDGHFRQIAPIDLGTGTWNLDEGWAPIGTSAADQSIA